MTKKAATCMCTMILHSALSPCVCVGVGGNPTSATTTTEGTKQLGNGNFCAIGTFKPEIEIWNLDVIEALGLWLLSGQKYWRVSE